MRLRRALFFIFLAFLLGACATTKERRPWQPGENIICPHCGRDFQVPEKLGP
jgi:hypothetical protein